MKRNVLRKLIEWKAKPNRKPLILIQNGTRIIPMEVKAEENVKSKSLRTYITKHPELKGMRLSMCPYSYQGWMENQPQYAVNVCMEHTML